MTAQERQGGTGQTIAVGFVMVCHYCVMYMLHIHVQDWIVREEILILLVCGPSTFLHCCTLKFVLMVALSLVVMLILLSCTDEGWCKTLKHCAYAH